MPPSSEQDTQPIPVNRSSTQKQAQKGTPPGTSTLSRRERENGVAKESGGMPVVTKSDPKTSYVLFLLNRYSLVDIEEANVSTARQRKPHQHLRLPTCNP